MVSHSHTAEYPDVEPDLPPRSRGVIALLEENCTVCMLCARECPDWCIYIDSHKETLPATTEGGRERQRNVLDRFDIDFSLCMYCGICIEVCPFDALHWSPEFEYAELDIRDLLHEKDPAAASGCPTVPPPRRARPPARADPKEVAAAQAGRPAGAGDRPPPTRDRARRRSSACSALLTAAAAVLPSPRRQVVHAALWLVTALGALAGCYLVLGAEVVALVQVLVYVGAVVVLVLFAAHAHPRADRPVAGRRPPGAATDPAAVAGLAAAGLLAGAAARGVRSDREVGVDRDAAARPSRWPARCSAVGAAVRAAVAAAARGAGRRAGAVPPDGSGIACTRRGT